MRNAIKKVCLLVWLPACLYSQNIIDNVFISDVWVDYFGTVKVNHADAPVGTQIEVYDVRGTLCGKYRVNQAGQYGFMHVYGQSASGDTNAGFRPQESLIFKIEGNVCESNPANAVWTNDGDQIQVNLTSAVQQTLQADAGGPYFAKEGEEMVFEAGPSDNVNEYAWDWDNDGVYDETTAYDYISKTWPDDGTFTVQLKVTDIYGFSDEANTQVTISNVAPAAVQPATQSVTIFEGDSAVLGPIAFTDPALLYDTFTASIAYGDGQKSSDEVLIENGFLYVDGAHVYGDNGTYDAVITVTDDDGGTGADTIQVVVDNVPPQVEANAKLYQYAGETITLDTLSFFDPAGSNDTYTLRIDWGDGSTQPKPEEIEYQENLANQYSHSYADSGMYQILIEISDEDGGTGCDTVHAAVHYTDDVPPVVSRFFPVHQSEDMPVNTPVHFDITDDFSGVDAASMAVYVNNNPILLNGSDQTQGDCDISAVSNGWHVFYQSDSAFEVSAKISIKVICQDQFHVPNRREQTFFFYTGSNRITEIAEQTVPENGGTLDFQNGVELTLPPDAVEQAQKIYVATVDDAPDLADTLGAVGPVYFFGPHGMQFNQPISCTMPLSQADLRSGGALSQTVLRVVTYSDSLQQWVLLDADNVTIHDSFIRFTLNHFSYYQIVAVSERLPAMKPGEVLQVINYPNPFNPDEGVTLIKVKSGADGQIDCKIYDASGMLVWELKDPIPVTADSIHMIEWDGRNGKGHRVSNDVYYCSVVTGQGERKICKIAVLR